MATTTLTVAADTTVSMKVNELAVGQGMGSKGAYIKAFTATAGTGNFPLAGFTLDLSALFPNKVLAVVCSPLYDPAVTTSDVAFVSLYIPSAGNVPSTGKVHIYSSNGAANAGLLHSPDDAVTISGFVITGFAIGY